MLEWKIIAAAFSAILVISILLAGNSGSDMFGGIFGRLTEWLGANPVQLPGGKSGSNIVIIELFPKNFTLNPGYKLNLSLGESRFENFNGDVSVDFQSGKVSLQEKGSSFIVSSPLQTLSIQEISLSKLSYQGKFALHSKTDISSENGTMQIQGFSGSFSLGNSSIILSGNVTKITGEGWTVG
jgi:hypothetical protein